MDENPYRAPRGHDEPAPRPQLAGVLRTTAAVAAMAVIGLCAFIGNAVFEGPTVERFAFIAVIQGSALAVAAWWIATVVRKRPTSK